MSLIQEALKRQQEDADKNSVGAQPASTKILPEDIAQSSAPPPLPKAAAPQETGDGKRAWPALLGVLLLLAMLVGAAVWMLTLVYKQFAATGTEEPVEITTTEAPDTPAAALDTTPDPEAPPEQPAPTPPPDKAPPEPPPLEVLPPSEPATEPDATSGEDTASTPPETAPDEQEPDTVQPIKPPPVEPPPEDLPEIPWPTLSVEGTVGTGKNGAAMLNGQIIRVGERIQGVTVQAVGKEGVVLEYKGRTRTVRAGGSTR